MHKTTTYEKAWKDIIPYEYEQKAETMFEISKQLLSYAIEYIYI